MTGQNGDLAFLPLGGTGEIGMNLNLYRLGDTWLAIDCGIGFSGNDTPEAEILVPDPAFIVERKNSLAGWLSLTRMKTILALLPICGPCSNARFTSRRSRRPCCAASWRKRG